MTLPNDKKALQDRLSRVAARMAQKFGKGTFTGVTAGAVAKPGIPVSVLVNRVAGKKISLDNLGGLTANALSFTVIDTANGSNSLTDDQLIASTYTGTNFPSGIYGSPTSLVMLAKLKAGLDSVDFHVIGDSNAGSPGTWGWTNGLGYGLIQGCSASMYATPVWNAGICWGSGVFSTTNQGFYSGLGFRNDAYFTSVGILGNPGRCYADGRLAPNSVKRYFNIDGVSMGMGYGFAGSGSTAYVTNFVWADGAGVTYSTNELNQIWSYYPTGTASFGIDTKQPLTYRVVHSLIPGHTGSTGSSLSLVFTGISTGYSGQGPMNGYIFGSADGRGATYYPPCSIPNGVGYRVSASSGLSGVTGLSVAKLTWTADSQRIGVTIGYNFYGRSPGFTYAYGPVAVYLESVHCNKKGWAISCIAYQGGFTTRTISDEIVKFAQTTDNTKESALKTVIRETRERQIEAGGTGNLIVFINSGINDVAGGVLEAAAAADYDSAISNITSTYRRIWSELRYPDNDLAFIVTISHPTVVGDTTMDDLRASARVVSEKQPDNNSDTTPYRNVMFVDITKLGLNGITYGGLTAGNAFNGYRNFYYADSAYTSHLEQGLTGGYSYLSELLMRRCLEYADIAY